MSARKRAEKAFRQSIQAGRNGLQTIAGLAKVLLLADKGLTLPQRQHTAAVILGNGPSLKESFDKHPAFFKDKALFAVNHSPNSDYFFQFRPQNYVFFDSNLWLYDPQAHKGMYEAMDLTAERLRRVDWPLSFYAPTDARNSVIVKGLVQDNPNIHMVYLNNVVVNGWKWVKYPVYRRLWGNPSFRNVVQVALYISLLQQYPEVYIVGADHNFHQLLYVDEYNDVWMTHHHFYDQSVETAYRSKLEVKFHDFKNNIGQNLSAQGDAFLRYYDLNEFAQAQGVKVWNASERSFIDAFPRYRPDTGPVFPPPIE